MSGHGKGRLRGSGLPLAIQLLAVLFDEFLGDVCDGRVADIEAVLPDRPDLCGRVQELHRLAQRAAT